MHPARPPARAQSHLECRLWNDVFVESQRLLGIPNGEEAAGTQQGQNRSTAWRLCEGGTQGAEAESQRRASPAARRLPPCLAVVFCHTWVATQQPPTRPLGACSPPLPPAGTIKATCLIETLPAAFEMDEFLYELRDHSAGRQHHAVTPMRYLGAGCRLQPAAVHVWCMRVCVHGRLSTCHATLSCHTAPGLNCGRWDYMFSFIKTLRK